MASPVVESFSSQAYQFDANVELAKPAGLANDDILVLMLAVEDGVQDSVTYPSGFVEFGEITGQNADDLGQTFAYKIITNAAGEPSTYTFDLPGTRGHFAALLRVSGANLANPIDATPVFSAGNSSSPSVAGITTTQANTLLLLMFSCYDAFNQVDQPTDFVEIVRLTTEAYVAWEKDQLSAGATGAISAGDLGATRQWVMGIAAIAPASSGGTTTPQAVSGTLGAYTGAITKRPAKSLTGVAGNIVGAITKRTNKALAGVSGAVSGAVARAWSTSTSLSGTTGSFTGALASSLTFIQSVTGVLGSTTGTISKTTGKALTGVSGALTGVVSRAWNTTASLSGTTGALTGAITKSIGKYTGNPANTIFITAGADDVTEADGELYTELVYGGASSILVLHTGLRFQDVELEQGTLIESALLRIYVADFEGIPVTTVYGVDADDAATWSNPGNMPTAAPRTTANVPGPAAQYFEQLIDVTAIVQEIIDRAGWAAGNNLSFVIISSSTGDNYWRTEDFNDVGNEVVRLIVTPAGASFSGVTSAVIVFIQALAGSLGPAAGSLTKLTGTSVTGILDAGTGTIQKLTSTPMSGTLGALSAILNTSIGLIEQAVSGVLGAVSGAITMVTSSSQSGATGDLSGDATKHTSTSFAGTLGNLTGTVTSILVFLISLGGTLGNFTGTATSSVAYVRALAGQLGSVTGAITKGISTSVAGVLTATGTTTKAISISLASTLGTLVGVFTSQVPTIYMQAVSGTLGALTGTVTFVQVIRNAIIKGGYSVKNSLAKGGFAIKKRISGGINKWQ